ncbi:MAG: DUF4136 domain-containing protein [Alphaproteobacteria bacterium]|nr:DUF4136 domain-containing protein [Alphaproteobacteria bacterium]
MPNLRKIAFIALAGAFLSACASSFESEITTYHRLPQPSGESFAIQALDPHKKGSLEFAQYARMVSLELSRVGYRPAKEGQRPDLIVSMDYGLSDGRTEVRSYGSSFGYGYYGYRAWPYYHPYYHPFGHGYGYGPDIRSYAVYTHSLTLEIASTQNPDQNIYESTVVTETRSRRLNEVMPYLVESLFQQFPGPSGQVREVEIPLDGNRPGSY